MPRIQGLPGSPDMPTWWWIMMGTALTLKALILLGIIPARLGEPEKSKLSFDPPYSDGIDPRPDLFGQKHSISVESLIDYWEESEANKRPSRGLDTDVEESEAGQSSFDVNPARPGKPSAYITGDEDDRFFNPDEF